MSVFSNWEYGASSTYYIIDLAWPLGCFRHVLDSSREPADRLSFAHLSPRRLRDVHLAGGGQVEVRARHAFEMALVWKFGIFSQLQCRQSVQGELRCWSTGALKSLERILPAMHRYSTFGPTPYSVPRVLPLALLPRSRAQAAPHMHRRWQLQQWRRVGKCTAEGEPKCAARRARRRKSGSAGRCLLSAPQVLSVAPPTTPLAHHPPHHNCNHTSLPLLPMLLPPLPPLPLNC